MTDDVHHAGFVRTEETWYQQLRLRWKPDQVRVLLVAESAPDPGAAERRFFYAPTVSRSDNLFRAVVLALYDEKVRAGDNRSEHLARLQRDGVWLIDLAPYPVNHLPSGERQRTLREHASERARDIQTISPDGIVICHSPTFRALAPRLAAVNAPLLHNEPIPFPLGNFRDAFVRAFRSAVAPLGFGQP